MTQLIVLIISVALFNLASTFSGDDKFIKKYAMMKVYESCFGPDVVKEVRKEMKIATAKCSGIMPSNAQTIMISNKIGIQPSQFHTSQNGVQSQSGGHVPHKHTSSVHMAVADTTKGQPPSFDLNKLQQAILEGYNKHVSQQQSVSSYSGASHPATQTGSSPAITFNQNPGNNLPQYRPHVQQTPTSQQPAFNLQPTFNGMPTALYTQPNYPMFYPNGMYQQSPTQQQAQPYYPTPVSNSLFYQPPSYFPYYPGTQRASRDLDIRGQLETLSAKMSGKVRNVTCVMQELGYLDENLEPDYEKMVQRINRLPVPEDLKKDMSDGVEFCRQFSMCVPDEKKDKLAREMVRPMFFFRCYKHKKLEACIMKDVRDRYSTAEEISEDSLPSGVGAEMRSMKNKDPVHLREDSMAAAVYEFLYGGDDMNIDSL